MDKNQEVQDHVFSLPSHITLTLNLYKDRLLHEYLARDDNLNQDVLVQVVKNTRMKKILHDWNKTVKQSTQFLAFYETATIAKGYDYFAFKLEETGRVYSLTNTRNEFSLHDKIALLKSLLKAINYLHQSNYIYGNITPDRILVCRSTEDEPFSLMMRPPLHYAELGFDMSYKKADFDELPESALRIADALYPRNYSHLPDRFLSLFDEKKTIDAYVYCTMNPFIAPEYTIEKTQLSDLYSIGILFYWLINGNTPNFDFEMIGLSEIEKILFLNDASNIILFKFLKYIILQKLIAPVDLSLIPESLQGIIEKLVRRDSIGFSNVDKLLLALNDLFAPKQEVIVTDNRNRPIEKAHVIIRDVEKNQIVAHYFTGPDGYTFIEGLFLKPYILSVEKDEYETYKVDITVGDGSLIVIQLESIRRPFYYEFIKKLLGRMKNEK